MAALHRMGPWLHSRHGANPAIPENVRHQWASDYRRAALAALAQHADCGAALALLEAQGFKPIALKGAFLSRHAYPDAALRPMRDIDILVPAERVLAAFEALIAGGYIIEKQSKIALEDAARLDKHMPPLTMPLGTCLELHGRLMERDGRLEYASPEASEADVRERSINLDGIRYPAPTDMLSHLIVHAVYGHRFDCGPLLLTDVHFLAAHHSIDWDLLWEQAHAQNWAAGGALVLALVRHYHASAALAPHHAEPASPTQATMDLARDLLVQDYTAKKNARFIATVMTGGFSQARNLVGGRIRLAASEDLVIDRAQDGGRAAWTLAKLRDVAVSLADPAQRRQARQLAQFRRWLEN